MDLASVIYQVRASHYADGHSSFEKEVREIQAIFLAGLAVLPLMVLFIGRICRRMLQPLSDIRETAERIIAGHLAERIQPENATDELGRLAATLNKAFDRYQDNLDRLQRFTGDASHQLRTPLTSIRTTGEVCLGKRRTPEEYEEVIGSMLEDADRLRNVVEKLLILGRMGADSIRAGFVPLDLGDVCARVLERYAPAFEVAELRATFNRSPNARVRGDAALLEQVLSNLLDNAIRHTWRGGTIDISLASGSGATWVLCVRDSGPGVAQELLPNLFQRFARGPGADLSGHGLGLAIVADTVRIHGGEIRLREGPGAAFEITLPAV
jgi:signal transduction histidine kinase